MKKLLFVILISISALSYGQNYADSLITVQGTQSLAFWVTKSIKINADTRKLPDIFKTFVGSGNNPDSLFTVTMKAGLLRAGIELLIAQPVGLALNDYRSIVLNQPAIVNQWGTYTSLSSQLTTLANGNGAQKLTAQWIITWYNNRKAAYTELYNKEKAAVIKLVQ